MAKAVPLTIDTLKTPQITPLAATPARSPATKALPVSEPMSEDEAKAEPKIEQVPLQIRIPKDAARAIKVAAAERDQTISEFMLACFHAYMDGGKTA
jgi:hypothetical protein